MQELLQIAARRGPIMLGHVGIDEMRRAARASGIQLAEYSYDPGVATRRTRLAGRGWNCAKVERRIRRSDAGYADARRLQVPEIHGYGELAKIYGEALQRREQDDAGIHDTAKQPAKYVFDRTEAVTRRLEIEQLGLKQQEVF